MVNKHCISWKAVVLTFDICRFSTIQENSQACNILLLPCKEKKCNFAYFLVYKFYLYFYLFIPILQMKRRISMHGPMYIDNWSNKQNICQTFYWDSMINNFSIFLLIFFWKIQFFWKFQTVPKFTERSHSIREKPLYLREATLSERSHSIRKKPLYPREATLSERSHSIWEKPLYPREATLSKRSHLL